MFDNTKKMVAAGFCATPITLNACSGKSSIELKAESLQKWIEAKYTLEDPGKNNNAAGTKLLEIFNDNNGKGNTNACKALEAFIKKDDKEVAAVVLVKDHDGKNVHEVSEFKASDEVKESRYVSFSQKKKNGGVTITTDKGGQKDAPKKS